MQVTFAKEPHWDMVLYCKQRNVNIWVVTTKNTTKWFPSVTTPESCDLSEIFLVVTPSPPPPLPRERASKIDRSLFAKERHFFRALASLKRVLHFQCFFFEWWLPPPHWPLRIFFRDYWETVFVVTSSTAAAAKRESKQKIDRSLEDKWAKYWVSFCKRAPFL